MNVLSAGRAILSFCAIAYVIRALSQTDRKIRDLVGELVIYRSSEGKELAGMVSKQGEQPILSHLIREDEEELVIDSPESVRVATSEEKREIVKALGFKRAGWSIPIWGYGGNRWNLLLNC